jgi:3D (Asp-Asp-Asp) domain-containing protein
VKIEIDEKGRWLFFFGGLLFAMFCFGFGIGTEIAKKTVFTMAPAVEVPIEGSLTASLGDIRQSLRDEALASAPEVDGLVITASYYGEAFHGKMTANWEDQEIFDMNAMTAAHKALPIGTIIFIENLQNGKYAVARINDRGPYIKGRELDVSKAVAIELGMVENGVIPVRIQILRRKES